MTKNELLKEVKSYITMLTNGGYCSFEEWVEDEYEDFRAEDLERIKYHALCIADAIEKMADD